MENAEKAYRDNLVKILKKLEKYALQLTHDRERANDLVQETSLRIINGYDGYQDDGGFTPWAKTIMKHTFLNGLKANNKKHYEIVDGYDYYNDEKVHPFVSENETPYTLEEIKNAIKSLPENQIKVLILREKGYKYEEIAEILCISLTNVKTRIFAARNNLRNIMNNLR